MQAAQIGSIQTVSATVPLKVSTSVQSSALPEAFGPRLQRDMLAAVASAPGPSPVNVRFSSGIDGPIVRVTSSTTDVNPAKNAPQQPLQHMPKDSAQSADTPTIAAGESGWVAKRPTIQGPPDAATVPATRVDTVPVLPNKLNAVTVVAKKVEAVPVPAAQIDAVPVPEANREAPAPLTRVNAAPAPGTKTDTVPVFTSKLEAIPVSPPQTKAETVSVTKADFPGVKRVVKASTAVTTSKVKDAPYIPSAALVLVQSTAVQIDIPAVALKLNIPQKQAIENSPTAASPAMMPGPPSTVAMIDKPNLAPQGPLGAESVTSGSAKQESPTTALQPRSQHGAGSALATLGRSATGTLVNTAVSSSIASSSHPNQVATLSAVAPYPAPIPPALSSARAEIQPHATTALNTSTIGEVHILPSAPTQLDVGVLDGTHGWLRIRAELGAGGAVSASLTASPLAHESLSAALPEMVKFLGSEGVSLSSVAVHRYSEDANPAPSSTSEGLLNANTQGHRSGGDQQRDGSGTQNRQSEALDQSSTPASSAITSSLAEPGIDHAEVISGSTLGLSRTVPGFFSPLGVAGGSSGNWLNVSA